MKIDTEQIINETLAIFERSGAADILRNFKNPISDQAYQHLHPRPLTPTNITIDCLELNQAVTQYHDKFQQWGTDHQHLPRYGLALVNQTGQLIDNDPINGSIMAWNRDRPTQPLVELDCTTPTEVMQLPALNPLRVFDGHWCRSNILKWHTGAFFYPHIDACSPLFLWIRLWAATSDGIQLRFYNPNSQELESVDYEPGRVYIIDTSLVHDALATGEDVLQLFLSVLPSAYDLLLARTQITK